ncbi:MAG: hypothetical protein AAB818_02980, partial [Patescibacteria group bacterium]
LLLVALFAFGASAEARVARLKVKKTADQPEVTAIAQGGVFAQFTAFDLDVVGGKGNLSLNNIRVEIYSEGKFGVENTPTIGKVFKKVCLVANTSSGNNETVERTIVSSLTINEGVGLSVDLGTLHWFGDNARFTVVGIPSDEAFYSENGRTIGLAVVAVNASDKKGKKAKISAKFPIMGIEQRIDPNAWAGSVYLGRTTLYEEGGIHPAIFVWGTTNVVVKKIAFQRYLDKDAKIVVRNYGNGVNKEYNCIVDKADNITACNFYKNIELSADNGVETLLSENDGIYLPAGSNMYIYSPNNAGLLNHFVDNNDIVIIGADMNYRYAPQDEGEGKACFLAGTMIRMGDGLEKPIENIKIGDSVWVGEGKADKVKGIVRRNDPEWLSFVAGNRIIFTVPDQIFFTVAYNQDGKPSPINEIIYETSLLKVGDLIRSDKGEFVTITIINPIQKTKVPTWDLILRSRTFYYANGFKVHSVME